MIMKECIICKKEIKENQIKIVGESEESHMLHLNCNACNNSMIFLATTNNIGVSLVAMVSDLEFNDAKKFYNKPAINEENLLEAYQIIHNISFNKYLISKK
ncbi:MAG: hypothetical protein WC070_03110 [Candidatus Magasanikbacteria bacterium]